MKINRRKIRFGISVLKHVRAGELAALILLLFIGVLPCYNMAAASGTQQRIAKQVVRLHVLANSDSERDQMLKLKVKQGIVEYLQGELSDTLSRDEALNRIRELFPQLKDVAENILTENGCFDSVEIRLEDTDFPEKSYGDLTFPAGNYTALRVLIGNGEGKNWWCILFPSLCYVDESYSVVPESSKEKLENSLSRKDYESLLKDKNTKVEYKFFLWEWIKG